MGYKGDSFMDTGYFFAPEMAAAFGTVSWKEIERNRKRNKKMYSSLY